MNMLFYVSSVFALLSIAILMNMKETLVQKEKFQLKFLKLTRHDIIAKEAIPAAIVTMLSYFSYGVILTLIPDWTTHVGIANKGIFFVVFTVFSILVRFFAGKASDRHGRIYVIRIGLALLSISLMVIGYFDDLNGLFIGSALYGVATGILSPAVNAWTADLSKPEERGKAMATMYIALEVGIGSGALIGGWYYADILAHIPVVLYISATITMIALVYMFTRDAKKQS